MIVYLDANAMKFKDEIASMLEEEVLYNPSYSGVDYEIRSDEFTWIEIGGAGEIDATFMLHRINELVESKMRGE